ncbi:MAG: hypothetical protein JSV63_03015 [Candidatus Aenigmatarchaeota archaeon]|nr:MAG: hypothetical protein JSV63_03015 [Candidatus Aenigmarchaeota archaeon]
MSGIKIMNELIAVALVAFLMLTAVAGAETYRACPASTKVENAWWDGTNCEGDVYAPGSLYMKWADAPFTNDTIEVTGVTLTVSAVSQGTEFKIEFWNGYSWSRISGGILDFRGDYVYELPFMPRPYADGSMRMRIINVGPETLHIENIEAEVVYESKIKKYTLTVRDCENNRRLEGVEVEVNGETFETDNDGEVVLLLPKDTVHEITIGGDDYYNIQKNVFLRDDDEDEVCIQFREMHAVDVDDLELDGSVIEFTITNEGNVDNDDIRYWVYVDDNRIFEGFVELDPDEEEDIDVGYDFKPGRHRIRAKAQAGRYVDSESIVECFVGKTDNFVCGADGKVLREVITSTSCASRWEVVKTCRYGCTDGKCDGEPVDDGVCGAEITSFSNTDIVPENMAVTVDVGVKNTGDSDREIAVKLYIDGRYADIEKVFVEVGQTEHVSFRFQYSQGTHTIRVTASACGSEKDSTSGTVKIVAPALTPGVPEGRQPAEADPLDTKRIYYIETSAEKLETEQYKSVTLKVTVHPPTETYMISVTGLDRDWFDYPKTVSSAEDGDFYLYITPQEAGEYTIKIRAWLEDDPAVSKVKEVPLTVTPAPVEAVPAPAPAPAPETEDDGVTGMAVFEESPLLGFLILAAIIATIMILIFTRHYMVETHDYDSNWPVMSHHHYTDHDVKNAVDAGDHSHFVK